MPKYHPRLVDVQGVKYRYIYRHGYLIPFPAEDANDEVLLAFAKAVVISDAKGPEQERYFKVLDGHLPANNDTDEPQIMFFPEPWDYLAWDENVPDGFPQQDGSKWPLPEEKYARKVVESLLTKRCADTVRASMREREEREAPPQTKSIWDRLTGK